MPFSKIYEKNMTLLDTKDKVGGYTLTKKEKEQLQKWRSNKLKVNKN